MSERIYNIKRKFTIEGEDKEQLPTGGHPINSEQQRRMIAVVIAIVLITALLVALA